MSKCGETLSTSASLAVIRQQPSYRKKNLVKLLTHNASKLLLYRCVQLQNLLARLYSTILTLSYRLRQAIGPCIQQIAPSPSASVIGSASYLPCNSLVGVRDLVSTLPF